MTSGASSFACSFASHWARTTSVPPTNKAAATSDTGTNGNVLGLHILHLLRSRSAHPPLRSRPGPATTLRKTCDASCIGAHAICGDVAEASVKCGGLPPDPGPDVAESNNPLPARRARRRCRFNLITRSYAFAIPNATTSMYLKTLIRELTGRVHLSHLRATRRTAAPRTTPRAST